MPATPHRRATLLVDAGIDVVLGILLLAFNPGLAEFLGLPPSSTAFYPSILGAVFVGIALALAVEAFRAPGDPRVGLGLVGAAYINLCGGIALGGWLLFGGLTLPGRGLVLLWVLVGLLVVLSGLELVRSLRRPR